MKVSAKALLISAFLVIFVAFSCSEDDGDDLTTEGPFSISELAGNWNATMARFSANNTTVDVVEDGGTATMTVQSNGKFTLNIDPVDRNPYSVSGTMFWEKWEGNYFFTIEWDDSPGDWDSYGASLNSNILQINGGFNTGEYDFDNDGTMEPAEVDFEFERI